MYEVVSLDQVKQWMKAEGTSGDDEFFIHLQKSVSQVIENYIDRFLVTRQYTEFYNGTGSDSLLLNQYPVYNNGANFSLWMDTERSFGASTLVDTDEYQIDAASGLITLLDIITYTGSKVIKAQYWAGESRFRVVAEANDRIDIDAETVQITAGDYIAETLAAEIETQLNDAGLTGIFTVTYNHMRQKFNIANDTGNFTLKWSTGSNKLKSIAALIGFDTGQDKSGAQSYEADSAVNGMPGTITLAAQKLVHVYFSDSKRGDGKQVVEQKEAGGDISVKYDKHSMPQDVALLLSLYRRFA